MKNKITKFLPAALALLSFSYGYADQTPGQKYDQGYGASKDAMNSAYNAPGRIDVNGAWDFFLTGSFIYWEARQNGLDYVVTHDLGATEDEIANPGRIYNMHFNYKPGFKVALGANFDHDDWYMMAEYTWLHFREGHKATPPSGYGFHATWQPNSSGDRNNECQSAHAKWRFRYDIIDLDLGRPYYTGTKLIFKPFVGMRGGWINERFKVKYDGYASTLPYTYPHAKQNTWLIGPRFGIGTDWHLGEGFRFFGNAAGGLYYQHFRTSYKITNATTLASAGVFTHMWRNKYAQITPNAEAELGFGWGSYFCDNGWHFDLLAAYQFQIYWDQNDMRAVKDQTYGAGSSDVSATTHYQDIYHEKADMMLHGLTVTLRLDF